MLCGQDVEDALPPNTYLEYFSPEYRLKYNRRPVSPAPDSLSPSLLAPAAAPKCWLKYNRRLREPRRRRPRSLML